MTAIPQNPPHDHHYIPVFYLKRWVADDGCLTEFARRKDGIVRPRQTFPKGTGYAKNLYSVSGTPTEASAQLETHFLAPTDNKAAVALEILHSGRRHHWTSTDRSAWSRFIMSLMFRTPEDIIDLKRQFREEWEKATPKLEAKYAAKRKPEDPATFAEAVGIETKSQMMEEFALSLGRTLMDHEKIGEIINGMIWKTVDTSKARTDFLTSDRPILMSASLRENDTFVVCPIGPTKLFVAGHQEETFERMASRDASQLVESVNELVVEHARKFVFGRDQKQLRFVQNRLSRRPQPSWLNRVERMRSGAMVVTEGDPD